MMSIFGMDDLILTVKDLGRTNVNSICNGKKIEFYMYNIPQKKDIHHIF